MLTHPTEQRLVALGLAGMAKALEEQRRQPDVAALPFEDWTSPEIVEGFSDKISESEEHQWARRRRRRDA